MSFKTLMERIAEKQNPSALGLDTHLDFVPPHIIEENFAIYGKSLEGAAKSIYAFNKGLIDAVHDLIPCVKLQSAYYEMYGYYGVKAFCKTIQYAKARDLYVIADVKRNDIGSTMQAYASAYFGNVGAGDMSFVPFGSDAMTVNGYLGSDGIDPVIPHCNNSDKGIFVLVKTSNPSSGELQDKLIDGVPLYSVMGGLVEKWGQDTTHAYGYSAIGAVVGATYTEQLKTLRREMKHTMFLVPGYGTQGGSAQDVAPAFDENGMGAIVNNSRAILTAWKKEGAPKFFGIAARREVMAMKDAIASVIPEIRLESSLQKD